MLLYKDPLSTMVYAIV